MPNMLACFDDTISTWEDLFNIFWTKYENMNLFSAHIESEDDDSVNILRVNI